MSPYYYPTMPVDRSTIRTRNLIHPDVLADPVAFIRKHKLQIRTTKPTSGRRAGRITQNITFNLLAYKGIKVELSKITGDPLVDVTIEFNPGVCLYGHNGRILLLTEFIDALALLVTNIRPILIDQDDWVDLVPGLRPGGRAYWCYLEILLQCRDTDGTLLAQLRHLRHPSITTPSRHWPDSMEVGGRRAKLRLANYRKACEMASRRLGKSTQLLSDEKLAEDRDILRLEARMKDEKLVHYFGNGDNVNVIDGKERLVWFFPHHLVHGHRLCYTELQGVFSSGEFTELTGKSNPNAALGQMLARVAQDPRVAQSLPALLASIQHYTGASSDTIRSVRKAAMVELARRSRFSSDELLSDTAYATQVGIASEEAEKRVLHDHIDMEALQLITKRYRPEGQPFHPHIELPSYLR